MIALIAVAALFAAAVLYQRVGASIDARRYPAPGRLIDAGGVRLHLYEKGSDAAPAVSGRNPAVILESGIAATSLSWALVQPGIAEFARVCSYDRAGLGWSGACATPRTVEQMVAELSSLLAGAAIPPPYILVGHSFGGLVIRAYAYAKPREVSGLVFVDPVSLEYWAHCDIRELRRLKTGARLARRGAMLSRLAIVRFALSILAAGGKRFPKLIARAAAHQGTTLMESLAGEVRKLPPEVWPLVRAHWSRPKCFEALARYLEAFPENARAALAMPVPPRIPFTILSAANATEAELAERDSWVAQSERGRHIRVPQCGHWIQLEQPDLAVEAVRELIEKL